MIVVAEEAGLGPVPADATTRRWLDLTGDATQTLSAAADRVVLVVAGRRSTCPNSLARSFGLTPGPYPGALHGDKLVRPGDDGLRRQRRRRAAARSGSPTRCTTAWERIGPYPDETEARRAIAGRARRRARAGARAQRRRRGLLAARRGHAARHAQRDRHARVRRARRGAQSPRPHADARPARARRSTLPPVPDDAELVFVTNPCNPTGTLHPRDAIDRARPPRPHARRRRVLHGLRRAPAAERRRARRGTVVLRSLTKAYSIAGLRAGYLIADPDARRPPRRAPPGVAGQRARARGDDRVGASARRTTR